MKPENVYTSIALDRVTVKQVRIVIEAYNSLGVSRQGLSMDKADNRFLCRLGLSDQKRARKGPLEIFVVASK